MRKPRRLAFQLDFSSRQPAYLQIVERIERLALGRRLQPGDQLPTVRDLAAQLGLNFNTVARAYRLLHRLRVVSAQQGRGTYVIGTRPLSAPRARRRTLDALAEQYIHDARRFEFSDFEIAAMIDKRLKAKLRR